MSNHGFSNLKSRVQRQQKKKIRKIRIYHSFLTVVLIFCIGMMIYSALVNFTKLVFYQSKIIKAQDLKAQADKRNKHLKNEIVNFNSMHKVESIARNNLKMAAKDEVLIIINQTNEEIVPEKTESKGITKFFEDLASKLNQDNSSDLTL